MLLVNRNLKLNVGRDKMAATRFISMHTGKGKNIAESIKGRTIMPKIRTRPRAAGYEIKHRFILSY